MKKTFRNIIYSVLPILSLAFALLLQIVIPNSFEQLEAKKPYWEYLVLILLGAYIVFFAASFFSAKAKKYLVQRGPFFAGAVLVFNIINLLTAKFAVLPTLYFPAFDLILEKMIGDRAFLLKCVLYSFRLLFTGFLFGATIGFATGLFLGYSRRFAYWVQPVTKIVGPIPTTAWLPIALSSFPTSFSASVFLIAFTVWFQLTLMTSSGIQSINKSYFEVAKTLGASPAYQILHIAIPGASSSIFLGLYYATCSSFITLMVAEMVGTSAGIGWYVNNQKSVMAYSGVYSGLILIAVICYVLLGLLFKLRSKILPWEKGIIKW